MDRNGPNPRTDFSRLLDQLASKQVIGTHNNLVWKV
jgi:hypothetical protein